MHRQHLAPVPGAGDRIVGGRAALGRDRERRRDAGLIEALAFQRALDRRRPDGGRRHGAIGDPRALDAPARGRQPGGDREHGNALRPDPAAFPEAESVSLRRPVDRDLHDEPRRAAGALRQQLGQRQLAGAIAARRPTVPFRARSAAARSP